MLHFTQILKQTKTWITPKQYANITYCNVLHNRSSAITAEELRDKVGCAQREWFTKDLGYLRVSYPVKDYESAYAATMSSSPCGPKPPSAPSCPLPCPKKRDCPELPCCPDDPDPNCPFVPPPCTPKKKPCCPPPAKEAPAKKDCPKRRTTVYH